MEQHEQELSRGMRVLEEAVRAKDEKLAAMQRRNANLESRLEQGDQLTQHLAEELEELRSRLGQLEDRGSKVPLSPAKSARSRTEHAAAIRAPPPPLSLGGGSARTSPSAAAVAGREAPASESGRSTLRGRRSAGSGGDAVAAVLEAEGDMYFSKAESLGGAGATPHLAGRLGAAGHHAPSPQEDAREFFRAARDALPAGRFAELLAMLRRLKGGRSAEGVRDDVLHEARLLFTAAGAGQLAPRFAALLAASFVPRAGARPAAAGPASPALSGWAA